VLLWTQLWTIGLINEGRPYAVRAELTRLLIVVPAGMALQDSFNWVIVGVYLAVSVGWLLVTNNLFKTKR
jgi:hypothetical protein